MCSAKATNKQGSVSGSGIGADGPRVGGAPTQPTSHNIHCLLDTKLINQSRPSSGFFISTTDTFSRKFSSSLKLGV
jgi:hypothetical protein